MILKKTLQIMHDFVHYEATSGLLLLFAAFLAVILNNSPLHEAYEAIVNFKISLALGPFSLQKTFVTWINEGLMAIFFLLVSLEIKREICEGELNTFAKLILPV